jgi:hypothetical protein
MLRAVFEPATPATKLPQTYALDRAATGIGSPGTNITLFLRCFNTNFQSIYWRNLLVYVVFNDAFSSWTGMDVEGNSRELILRYYHKLIIPYF